VRNERNQAREESKQLRVALEHAMKDSHSYKREKYDLECQITQLKKEMEKIHICLIKHAGQHKEPEREISGSPIDQLSNDGLKNVNSEDGLVTKARSFSENENSSEGGKQQLDIEEYVLQGAMPKDIKNVEIDFEEKQLLQKLKTSTKSDEADFNDDHDYLTQKIKMLQLRLDDAQKAICSEKE
jgi:coiled-coil domain-containing protein 102